MSEQFRWEVRSEAKVKLELPTSWKESRPEPNILVISSPDDEVAIEIVFIDGPHTGAKFDDSYVMGSLKNKLGELKIMNPPTNFEQNGLHGFSVGGGAKASDGKVMQFFSIALGDGKGHGLVSFGRAAHRGFVTHGETIKRVTGSIQPA